jgi:hypothetical protein
VSVTKDNIVLIPYWIQETLQRHQLPLSTCLDIGKLKPLLPFNDLVTFLALQEQFENVLGTKYIGNCLTWIWSDLIPNDNSALKDYLWKQINPLSEDQSFEIDIKSRLFNSDARTSQYQNAFITYDLPAYAGGLASGQNNVGVVIYPGFFTVENSKEHQLPLIREILKLLYVYQSSHEVAKTPLYKRYLELLAN